MNLLQLQHGETNDRESEHTVLLPAPVGPIKLAAYLSIPASMKLARHSHYDPVLG